MDALRDPGCARGLSAPSPLLNCPMTTTDSPTVQHDPDARKFFIAADGGESRLSYRPAGDGKLDFVSTFTSPELRGRGLAGRVVAAGLDYAREQGLQVIPSCPFVGSYVDDNPRYADLVVEQA